MVACRYNFSSDGFSSKVRTIVVTSCVIMRGRASAVSSEGFVSKAHFRIPPNS